MQVMDVARNPWTNNVYCVHCKVIFAYKASTIDDLYELPRSCPVCHKFKIIEEPVDGIR